MRSLTLRPACAAALFVALVAPTATADNREVELAFLRNHGTTASGHIAGDEAGAVVAGVGDVNDDGFDDVLVTSWKHDGASVDDTGRAYLVYGSADIDDLSLAAADVLIEGDEALGDFFTGGPQTGLSACAAGDVNNDGIDDFLIGAPNAELVQLSEGVAYLIYGSTTLPATLDLASLGSGGVVFRGANNGGPGTGEKAGFGVAGGDFNGDAFSDILIGAPSFNVTEGRAYVVYGSDTFGNTFALDDLDTLSNLGVVISAAAGGGRFGQRAAHVGDMDGDGFGDFVVSASEADPAGKVNAGQAHVIFGGDSHGDTLDLATATTAESIMIQGEKPGAFLADSLSGAGDVDGDGFDDLILGSPSYDPGAGGGPPLNTGRAYIIYGDSALPAVIDTASPGAHATKLLGVDAQDGAGSGVGGGMDVNGDDYDDVIIGAHNADPNGGQSGEIYVVYGGPALPASLSLDNLSSNGYVLNGITGNDRAGGDVAMAGDVNGDGLPDMLVAALSASPSGASSGEVYLVLGTCHVFHIAGVVAESGLLQYRAHGVPTKSHAFFLAVENPPSSGLLASPVTTKFGPYWLFGELQIWTFAFDADGEFALDLPFPDFAGALIGVTLQMQTLQEKGGNKCDVSLPLSVVVQ